MVEKIQSYDSATRGFAQPVSYKVKKLLELGRISCLGEARYQVLPIPGYNYTTYNVKEQMGKLMCTCQKGRKGLECSHIVAVRIYRDMTEPKHQQKQMHLL